MEFKELPTMSEEADDQRAAREKEAARRADVWDYYAEKARDLAELR